MSSSKLADNLIKKLNASKYTVFESPEEYFFVLGQFLVYAFSLLGGLQQHPKEFNYLTNPYLPMDVQQLGIRSVRFLTKLAEKIEEDGSEFLMLMQSLINDCKLYCHSEIPMDSCTDSFFEGLHSTNILLQLKSRSQIDTH